MRKIKLLLVDDEEDFARTMAERLEMKDVSSRVALSGEEALEMVDRDAPDVMVLDLRMPGIDGMQVLERVRTEHPHVQVIVLTGRGTEEREREARELGAFEYLEKPADTPELLDAIRSAWRRARKILEESKEGFEGHMMAAAMAEAGEARMALEELERTEGGDRERGEEGSSEPPGLKVLFVDDEEDFVHALAERMEMRKLGGQVALSGEEALEMIRGDAPDVMVLDLRMPGMGGMEVLRRVKEAHPYMEVVIMTGHGSARDEAEARRLGAFDYLQKPVDFHRLMETVAAAGQAARRSRAEARGRAPERGED